MHLSVVEGIVVAVVDEDNAIDEKGWRKSVKFPLTNL